MLSIPLRSLLAAGLLLAMASVQAQSNPEGSAPALQYRSVFTAYRAFEAQPVATWSEINDTVGRIGGWRAYAKEGTDGNVPPAPAGQGAKGDTSGGVSGSHMGRTGRP